MPPATGTDKQLGLGCISQPRTSCIFQKHLLRTSLVWLWQSQQRVVVWGSGASPEQEGRGDSGSSSPPGPAGSCSCCCQREEPRRVPWKTREGLRDKGAPTGCWLLILWSMIMIRAAAARGKEGCSDPSAGAQMVPSSASGLSLFWDYQISLSIGADALFL